MEEMADLVVVVVMLARAATEPHLFMPRPARNGLDSTDWKFRL